RPLGGCPSPQPDNAQTTDSLRPEPRRAGAPNFDAGASKCGSCPPLESSGGWRRLGLAEPGLFRARLALDEGGGQNELVPGLEKAAFVVGLEAALAQDVVGAGIIVDDEGAAAGIADGQAVELIAGALAAGSQRPALGAAHGGLGHEDAVAAAVADGETVKGVVAGLAHEDAEVVVGQ